MFWDASGWEWMYWDGTEGWMGVGSTVTWLASRARKAKLLKWFYPDFRMQESWRAGPGHPTSQAGACQCNLYFYWFAHEIPASYWLQIRDSSTLIGSRPQAPPLIGLVTVGSIKTLRFWWFQVNDCSFLIIWKCYIWPLSHNFDHWTPGIWGMAIDQVCRRPPGLQ